MHALRDISNRSEQIAIERLGQGCNGTEEWACGTLGYEVFGEKGSKLGKTFDPQASEKWLKLGCDKDDSLSCARLAHLYDDSASFAKGDAEQLALFEKACDLGDANGCANIGMEHLWGDGIPNRSSDIAISRLKEGCRAQRHGPVVT